MTTESIDTEDDKLTTEQLAEVVFAIRKDFLCA